MLCLVYISPLRNLTLFDDHGRQEGNAPTASGPTAPVRAALAASACYPEAGESKATSVATTATVPAPVPATTHAGFRR